MKRYATDILIEWKNRSNRKPMVIRGARQVGKSHLVRTFGQEYFNSVIEVNFEQEAWAEELFAQKTPADTLAFLEARYKQRIVTGETLLFLDELQAGPAALASLRYFYEQTPQLHTDDLLMVNSGAICEQFIGQHLLYNAPSYQQPELYCWIRQKAGTSSEVDYVIQHGTRIIPVEVKAGTTGRLKSLHVFMLEKHRDFALRFNANTPSLMQATTAVASREAKDFHLLSLPLYMVGQTNRLIKSR